MALWLKIVIIVLVILVAALVALYILGTKMQKKQAQQQSMMEAMAQTVSMLVIDKKRLKLKDAGFPKMVYDQTPKYLRRAKVPVVKAKVGPKIMTLMCDEKVFAVLPVKQEAKVVVSGIYITAVKSVRGSIVAPPAKKKKLFGRSKKDNKDKAAKSSKK
ncbi:hypothetical protein [Fusibacillus kribbianus]|uniref:Uncharacterized protein n=1 Tax=Fusibacillus kribbianus TaxID=3044208 RepID=A0AAP4B8R2_9FIRM|nr:hypothetical protein [Ruminococcus sp. YH-rum2234]MDI9241110.1 hypothetical protein [Ruminococcus sp. YH-rum2234]